MKVIVVGGGKIGFYLTQTLLEHGHEPVLIEKDPDVCLRVANSLDLPVIQGDGTVLDTLENAGIRNLMIEVDQESTAFEQIRTRLQTFKAIWWPASWPNAISVWNALWPG